MVPFLSSQVVVWGTHEPASHKTAMVNSSRSLPPFFLSRPSSCIRSESNNQKHLRVMNPWILRCWVDVCFMYTGKTSITDSCLSSKNTFCCLIWFSWLLSYWLAAWCICCFQTNLCMLGMQNMPHIIWIYLVMFQYVNPTEICAATIYSNYLLLWRSHMFPRRQKFLFLCEMKTSYPKNDSKI
jgi:hypothetical protein